MTELLVSTRKLNAFIIELFKGSIEHMFIAEQYKNRTPNLKELYTAIRCRFNEGLQEFIDEESILIVKKKWLDNIRYGLADSLHITGSYKERMQDICNIISKKLEESS